MLSNNPKKVRYHHLFLNVLYSFPSNSPPIHPPHSPLLNLLSLFPSSFSYTPFLVGLRSNFLKNLLLKIAKREMFWNVAITKKKFEDKGRRNT
jgi:hypothetical protein